MKRFCPKCQEIVNTDKKQKSYVCTKCNTRLALCPLDKCDYVWIPRTENPRECPKCKRYLP